MRFLEHCNEKHLDSKLLSRGDDSSINTCQRRLANANLIRDVLTAPSPARADAFGSFVQAAVGWPLMLAAA